MAKTMAEQRMLLILLLACAKIVVSQTPNTVDTAITSISTGSQNTSGLNDTTTQPQTTTTQQTDTFPDPVISATDDLIVCVCDLTQYQCDINCCCDTECTEADRLVFSECVDQLTNDPVESRLCSYSVKVFRDNTVTEETVNNPNLFCLWRDGKSTRNYYTVTDLAKTKEQYGVLSEQADNTYSFQYQAPTLSLSNTSVYKNDEVLLAIDKSTSQVSVLSVPSGLASTSSCIDSTPAQFLRDRRGYCNRPLSASLGTVCERTDSINANRYAQNLNDVQVLPTSSEGQTAGLDLVIVGGNAPPSFDVATSLCYNVLTQVDYVVSYKSGVITEVKATFITSDLSADSTTVSQLYTIKYEDLSADENSFSRSGNPGYLIGKPLLAGIGVENFISLSGDNNQYLTMVTASAAGDCVTDSLNRRQILFGENFRSGCVVKATLGDLDNNCQYIQSQVIEAMLGPSRTIKVDGTLYIASFGNSDPLRLGDWVQVIVANEVVEGSCKGVATHLEVLYADHGELHNPQARIIGAKLTFEPIKFEFMCLGSHCQANTKDITEQFEMITSVTFVDVTQTPVQAFSEKPVVKSKLPANFFHPYYLSHGTSISHSASLCVFLALCSMSQFFSFI